MKNILIKPIGTAIWLIQNSRLTFKQIANFCGISEMEVSAMANGFDKASLEPNSPIKMGQLTPEEIKRCEEDSKLNLRLVALPIFNDIDIKVSTKVFTPISKRKDKISAILWLTKNTKLSILQIVKLTNGTKKVVVSMIDGTYPNADISPKDPVQSGICTQSQLNEELSKIDPVKEEDDRN